MRVLIFGLLCVITRCSFLWCIGCIKAWDEPQDAPSDIAMSNHNSTWKNSADHHDSGCIQILWLQLLDQWTRTDVECCNS